MGRYVHSEMTSAIKGFGPSEKKQASNLIFYIVICALIAPCMVGVGLSQKLSRWPEGGLPFFFW